MSATSGIAITLPAIAGEITIVKEFGFMTKEDIIFKLACAILPGLMSRYGEPGYSDLAAIGEAFNLSFRYFDSIKAPTSETAESPATDRQHTQAKMPSWGDITNGITFKTRDERDVAAEVFAKIVRHFGCA